jgi:hypothetical protein
MMAAGAALVLVLVALCSPAAAAPAAGADDTYLAGYVAAVLERQLHVPATSVRVQQGVVTVDAGDLSSADRRRIVTALRGIRGIARVEFAEVARPAPPVEGAAAIEPPDTGFLPGGYLFQPLLADPRWPHFSAAYRYSIRTEGSRNTFAASFGETIPLYRDALGEHGRWGRWEVGVQAGVFSIFDLDAPSFDLVNTDFLVGTFLAYRYADFSALGRLFHQSSHLGDEFLLRATRPDRVNVSFEGVDAKLSYDLPLGLRAYGGGGYLVHVDPTSLDRGFLQAGGEWRTRRTFWPAGVRPVAGVDLQFREENDWRTDLSVRAGVQLDSVSVLDRSLQLLVEYFNGRSFDGQFYRDPVEYIGLGVHFNF